MRPPLAPQQIQDSRDRLVELATHLCQTEGADALSLRRLAAAAGMSRSTPYQYFKNRDEIVDAVRAAALDRLTERSAAALAETEDRFLQMRALGRALVEFACESPKIYHLLFSRPVFSGPLPDAMSEAVDRFRKISRPPLREALRCGLVHGEEEVIRRTTWAAFHGLISLHLHGHLDTAQLESDFDALNQFIGLGILTDSGRAHLSSSPH